MTAIINRFLFPLPPDHADEEEEETEGNESGVAALLLHGCVTGVTCATRTRH